MSGMVVYSCNLNIWWGGGQVNQNLKVIVGYIKESLEYMGEYCLKKKNQSIHMKLP